MVQLEKAVTARLARFGTAYEILVDPDGVETVLPLLHQNGDVPDDRILGLLAAEDIFVDAGKGDRASDEQLDKAFETRDTATIARRILVEGEVQLTADQRKRMAEQKRKRVLDHILRHAWNPQTKTPHPRDRIERALDEAKFRVDPLKHVEEQAGEALKRLRPLLPIAFERVRVAIRVPAEHTGTAYGVLRSLGDLKKEEWQDDGALIVVLEIPAGAQTEVYDRINQVTQGSAETRLL